MRHQLIEALTYPRLLVQDLIDERDCPHENLFEATSERCHQCDINNDCHWISCLNDFSDFEDKQDHTINAESTCTCEPCTWVRDAQRLTEEFDAHLESGIHGPMY